MKTKQDISAPIGKLRSAVRLVWGPFPPGRSGTWPYDRAIEAPEFDPELDDNNPVL